MANYEKLTKAGINIEELLKRLMGNASLLKVFINKFTEDQNYKLLSEAFSEKDMEKAEHASHTLKGMCGNMSLGNLFELFSEQVNLLRSGEFDKAEAMMQKISLTYNEAIRNMKEWLSEN